MLKWVNTALRLSTATATATTMTTTAIAKRSVTTTKAKQSYTTTSKMRTSINSSMWQILAIFSITAALAHTTNGFKPIDANASGGARKLFGGYRITPKHCRATKTLAMSDPRKNGPTICMFNHECAQRNGEVVGACMDGFLFGACCQVPKEQDLESTLLNDAQNVYYHQHQQQKLQEQQYISSNQAVAQSYEIYGESQQNSQEEKYSSTTTAHNKYQSQQQHKQPQQHKQKPQNSNIYAQTNLDKVYQQLESSSTTPQIQSNIDKLYQQLESSSTSSNKYETTSIEVATDNYDQGVDTLSSEQTKQHDSGPAQQQLSQQLDMSSSIGSSTEVSTQSGSNELEQEAQLQTDQLIGNTNNVVSVNVAPPKFHVHKNSVKISSPSSPPHNDDFVLQVLSTLPPGHDNDQLVTFTTEVPMKIASNLLEHSSSSESSSNSFEEPPNVTQAPTQFDEKSTNKNVDATAQKQQQQLQHKQQLQQKQPLQQKHQLQKHQQQQQQQQQPEHQNTHNHNHLLLDGGEFTHSDITHPGADADLIEDDLQFSTGYGPQPVYIQAPNRQPSPISYNPSSSSSNVPFSPQDKYEVVENSNNEEVSKRPTKLGAPTTGSAITTHVDSIESIILQLNGTSSHGPAYSVINHQTASYDSELGDAAHNKYASTTGQNQYTTNSPTQNYNSVTTLSSNYYDELETKRPEDHYTENELTGQQENYPATSAQLPAYLEPITTKLNLTPTPSPNYDSAVSIEEQLPAHSYVSAANNAEVSTSSANAGYGEDSSSVLDEHTMPANNYNDALQSAAHQTSEFNKMPAVGIAYPVDMSYMEEEGNIAAEQSETAPSYASSPPQSTTTAAYPKQPESDSAQDTSSYLQVPVIAGKPQRPAASYIGVVNSQNYETQTLAQSLLYSQLPEEVLVSSHTTKVQDYQESASPYQTQRPEKLSTINSYSGDTTNAQQPTISKPTLGPYIASTTTPVALRPQYDSVAPTSTTLRPISGIITSSGTRPRPKPRPKPNTSRPNIKKTKPSSTKRPSSAQPSSSYSQSTQPVNNYNEQQESNVKKPTNAFDEASYSKPTTQQLNTESLYTKKPSQKPSNNFNSEASYQGNPAISSYNQEQQPQQTVKQPSNSYQQQKPINTKRPSTQVYSVAQSSTSTHNTKPTRKRPSSSYTGAQTSSSYGTTSPTTRKPISQNAQSYDSNPQENIASYGQSNTKIPIQPSINYNQDYHVVSSPTKTTGVNKPTNKKPISTSYVSGPTTPRPPTTFVYHNSEVPPLVIADDKLDAFVQSTAQSVATPTSGTYSQSSFHAPLYASSITPVYIERPQNNYNTHKKPGFVQITATSRPPAPTVVITPKPTIINLVTSSNWSQRPSISSNSAGSDDNAYPPTTPIPAFSSTSYIFSPLVTRRPELALNTPDYVSLPAVTSNDFDDPGYYGVQNAVHPAFTQATTEAVFAVPSDDRPAFPGYYGPTPTYPAFVVPGEKVGSQVEEETYTSPNDFVNFPPVRNPNLNMSAASSAVTTDLELSTPAFVEDVVLKDKMNTLVHKIVESLQGNFEALADMIDDVNNTVPANTYQVSGGTTRKPTRKPSRVTTAKPKTTTKRPATRATTKTPTRRPTGTTQRPVTRRTTTTRKPATRKPTRKVTTTTLLPTIEDELVDEEDEEDVNPADNEIGDQEDAFVGAGGRKFKCGVRPHIKSGRIVGGKGSTFGAYPWQVLVRESTWLGLFTKNKCGGVLITNRYVITAAHCQPGFLASLVAVMGEFDISGDLESKRAVTKNVKRVIVHRQYDPATFENDLALLELESAVQYDTHIVPICMPNDNADFTGRMATVTGWGRLKYGGGVPSVLQEVQVPIIENSVCQEMFHTAGHNKKILSSFLCAGYANGQKDSCEGDSGGPLVLQRPDGRYELAGTVSHGIKCAAPYLPGVYMRTTFYKPWLRSITGVK